MSKKSSEDKRGKDFEQCTFLGQTELGLPICTAVWRLAQEHSRCATLPESDWQDQMRYLLGPLLSQPSLDSAVLGYTALAREGQCCPEGRLRPTA